MGNDGINDLMYRMRMDWLAWVGTRQDCMIRFYGGGSSDVIIDTND
jgi:hypothetical protein